MYKLACHDLGNQTCTFEASGETESEVKQKMSEHAHESHAADIAGKTDEEFEKVMSDSVREA